MQVFGQPLSCYRAERLSNPPPSPAAKRAAWKRVVRLRPLTFEYNLLIGDILNPKTFSPLLHWTVARFPNGEWTTGGKITDADYMDCEVFRVLAFDRNDAKREAQKIRRRKTYVARFGRDIDF